MKDSGIGVVLPAAGAGARMGGVQKAFLALGGEPLLLRSLRPFLAFPGVEAVVVALPPGEAASPPAWLVDLDPRIRIVPGGQTRSDSVLAALEALDLAIEVVLVHDAARPLVTPAIIRRCVDGVSEGRGAIAGWPVVDTLKEVNGDGVILATPDRNRFRVAQTPQAFPLMELLAGYRRARDEGVPVTDDAQAFALTGGRVHVVDGSPWNLKVTHPEDVALAEFILAHQGTER